MDDMLALALAYGLLIALLLGHSILTALRIKDLDERLKAATSSIANQPAMIDLTDSDTRKARESASSDDE